ncbi:protein of unknown function [Burkholderia multivorans]
MLVVDRRMRPAVDDPLLPSDQCV